MNKLVPWLTIDKEMADGDGAGVAADEVGEEAGFFGKSILAWFVVAICHIAGIAC